MEYLTLDTIYKKDEMWCSSLLNDMLLSNIHSYSNNYLKIIKGLSMNLSHTYKLHPSEYKYINNIHLDILSQLQFDQLKNIAIHYGYDISDYSNIKLLKFILNRLKKYNMRPINFYGRFLLTLNKGSYGDVNLYQENTKLYAIKESNNEYSDSLLLESNILRKMDNPYIIKPIDTIFNFEDNVSLVLPIGRQLNLTDFNFDECKQIAFQIALGLAHAHNLDILHLDLKPSNLIYTSEGIKIIDWGMSKLNCHNIISTFTHKYTLYYRPLENLLDYRGYSFFSDIWAYGCILAELFNKEPLFKSSKPSETISKIISVLGFPKEETDTYTLFNIYTKDISVFKNIEKKGYPSTIHDTQLIDLLNCIFTYDYINRINIFDILNHPFFDNIRNLYINKIPILGYIERLKIWDGGRVIIPDIDNFFHYVFDIYNYNLQLNSRKIKALAVYILSHYIKTKLEYVSSLEIYACIYLAEMIIGENILNNNNFNLEDVKYTCNKILLNLNFNIIYITPLDYLEYISLEDRNKAEKNVLIMLWMRYHEEYDAYEISKLSTKDLIIDSNILKEMYNFL